MEKVQQICFPNTVKDSEQSSYSNSPDRGYEIERFTKNGEMAEIGWFKITKSGLLIAEIKESVCDIYF